MKILENFKYLPYYNEKVPTHFNLKEYKLYLFVFLLWNTASGCLGW